MKTVKENINDLFENAYNFMFAASGDGCALIVCDTYVDIANYFQEWLVTNSKDDLVRVDDNEYKSIRFENDQEAIVFTCEFSWPYRNFYDLAIILPFWYADWLHDERNLL